MCRFLTSFCTDSRTHHTRTHPDRHRATGICLFANLFGWLFFWLFCWLFGCLVLFVFCLAGCLFRWLVDWLAGCSVAYLFVFAYFFNSSLYFLKDSSIQNFLQIKMRKDTS